MINKYDFSKLTRKRYKELIIAEAVLNALYAGGVDNWEWYSESLIAAGLAEDEDENEDD